MLYDELDREVLSEAVAAGARRGREAVPTPTDTRSTHGRTGRQGLPDRARVLRQRQRESGKDTRESHEDLDSRSCRDVRADYAARNAAYK